MRNNITINLLVLLVISLVSCVTPNKDSKPMDHLTASELRKGYCDSRFGQIHFRYYMAKKEKLKQNPVVFLHLSPNSSQVFTKILPKLGIDRIAIAPDYPGYGMSDSIPGSQKISDYAKAMLDVIDSLGLAPKIDLLGYHTGSAVAVEMAKQRPELFNKLALVAVPVLTEIERKNGAALPKIPFDTLGDFAKKEWQSSWKWRGPGQSQNSVYSTFSAKMRPGTRERGAQAILAYDLEPELKKVSHPVLLVNVKDDLWEVTKRAKKILPKAQYLEIPEHGHGLFHAVPEKMDSIIRNFLDN